MKRIIKWESQHLEIDTITGKLNEPEDEDTYDDEEEYVTLRQGQMPIQDVMSTPFGLWRVDDSMNPYKQFKMWMGHTNFSITPEVAAAIKEVPGIEVLQVMTRYRFIIGVGELFDIRTVRTTIEENLNCHRDVESIIRDKNILREIDHLKTELKQHDQWAIYVFPNGQIDFTTSNEANFGKQLNLYKKAVDYSNGILIESEND